MMGKPKRKPKQQNFLNYFLNEFILFRRDFSFETHLSPEEASDNLENLKSEKQGCWQSRRIVTKVITDSIHEISFEMKSERSGNGGYSMDAKAVGTIYTKKGATIIEGSAVMNIIHLVWICCITFSLINFVYLSIDAAIFQFVVFNIAMIPLWLQMYFDRNYLVKIIENAVQLEKAKISA